MEHMIVAEINNPHASSGLKLSLQLCCNVSDEQIADSISVNGARNELPWLSMHEEHSGRALIVGGGPSAADHIDDIRRRKEEGAVIFAMNGSSNWLRDQGIEPDHQVVIDGTKEIEHVLDRKVRHHFMASQVLPWIVDLSRNVTLVHLSTEGVEDYLPTDRKNRTSYCLIGGGYGVGNSATCIAYALGFRDLTLYGMDSSNRDGNVHSYDQKQGVAPDRIETIWNGKTYSSSFAMKAQAERFQEVARELKDLGCNIRVIGEGLLPDMYNCTPSEGKQNA